VILAINTFQRSLAENDQMRRPGSIKMLSSIVLKYPLSSIQEAIGHVIGDAPPYIKKAAAFAMITVYGVQPAEIETRLPQLWRLLGDNLLIAFSGAILAYWCLCRDSLEFLDPGIKWICSNITKFHSSAQALIMRAFTGHRCYCFNDFEGGTGDYWGRCSGSRTSHAMSWRTIRSRWSTR
jgi:AP-3 complex subunit beta